MLQKRWTKVLVFVACLAPLFWLCWRGLEPGPHRQSDRVHHALHGRLDAPLHRVHAGRDAAAQTAGAAGPDPFRRMIGLFAFFYGTLHFMTYIWLDKFFDSGGDAARTSRSGRSSRRASRRSC